MALNSDALTTVVAVERRLPVTVDNDELEQLINAFSRTIRHYTRRQFIPKEPADDANPVVEKTFRWSGWAGRETESFISLAPYELRSLNLGTLTLTDAVGSETNLIVDTDYTLDGLTSEGTYLTLRLLRSGAGTGVGGTITIPGRWGAGSVPPDVEQACLIAVRNQYMSPEGFQSRSMGEFTATEFPESADTEAHRLSLPPDAMRLLYPYRRPSFGIA